MAKKISREWFVKKYGKDFFHGKRGMRLSKTGHEALQEEYAAVKIEPKNPQISTLAMITLQKTLQFPWYTEKRRRTTRTPKGQPNIERKEPVFFFYGDEVAIAFLTILGMDLDKWARAMTDSRIWRTLLHPLPEKNWDMPAYEKAQLAKAVVDAEAKP